MRKNYFKPAVISLFCLIISSCGNSNTIHFKDFPADYKIAYFDDMGVANIPSIRNLFGKQASYADEFMGTPVRVIIDSHNCTSEEFSAIILVRVIETDYDIARIELIFKADENARKSFVRYVKVESLVGEQYLEQFSDGTEEQDIQAFELFLRYMHLIWK